MKRALTIRVGSCNSWIDLVLPQSHAQRDYGFAVRCEAVALPRRQAELIEGATPRSAFAGIAQFQKRAQPDIEYQAYGGAEPPPHIGRRSRNEE